MITKPDRDEYVKLTGEIRSGRFRLDSKMLRLANCQNRIFKVCEIDNNSRCNLKLSIEFKCDGKNYYIWLYDDEYEKWEGDVLDYDLVDELIENEPTGIKELLEKGIKITRDDFKYKYIYKKDDRVITDGNCVYGITLEDLDSEWYEYKKNEFETHNNIKPNDFYYYIDSNNVIQGTMSAGLIDDVCKKNSMNCYPDKKTARLMRTKLDLIRKIETFAYLNNDWDDCKVPYCIYSELNSDDVYSSMAVECEENETLCATQFSSKEIAEKCLEIYDEDFERYLLQKKNFGGN